MLTKFMPRRSIWKGSFVDAFLLRIQKKRESLLSRSSTTHYYTEILLSVISVLFPLWVYAGIYQLLDFLGLSIPIPIIIVAACEFEEDKEKEDEVDLNFTLAPPRSSGECFARSHLLEKEGDFGSIVASNGAVGGEEVNSRRGMDTTPLIEPDRA